MRTWCGRDRPPAHAPRADALLAPGTMPIDPIVFVFAFAVAVVTGVAVGLIPALRGSRSDVTNELNGVPISMQSKWSTRSVDMHDAPTLVRQDNEDEQHAAGKRRDREEIHGRRPGEVIGEERSPRL